MANVITCFPPEIPRDCFYSINPKARAKRADRKDKKQSLDLNNQG